MLRSRVILSAAAVVAIVGASVGLGALAAYAAPDAPVITSVGTSIASNAPITIEGNAENPLGVDQVIEVHVVVDGVDEVYCTVNLAYFEPDPTTWSCADLAPLAFGDNTFYAVQWELGDPGDVSNPSNEVTYRIGSTAPSLITGPTSGTATTDSTPSFTGTGPHLGSVTVQVQGSGQQLCTAAVSAAGAWFCTPTMGLSSNDGVDPFDAEETYTIEAVGTQVDSVVQPVVSTTDVTIQRPDTPVIDYYYAGTPPWQTGNSRPAMQGSMGPNTANTTVWISTDGGSSFSHYCNVPTTSEALTVWYCTDPTTDLQPGINMLGVSTQNAYGNQSMLSSLITVELVGNPSITSVPDGGYTNDATPTFSGPAPWGSTFQVYKDSGPSASTFLCNGPAAAGSFSCDSVPLVDGAYVVHVYSNDGIDVSSQTIAFTVDTVAPDAPVITTGGSTNDTTPLISGTGEPGSTITVYRDGAPVICSNAPVVADGGGAWSCQTLTPLTPGGTYSWGATQQDVAGNLSDPGVPPAQTLLTILTPPPPAPVLPTPTATPTPSPTVPPALEPQPWTFEFGAGGTEFERGDSTELTGSGLPPGALVEAEFHSTPVFLGSTSVTDAGTFSLPVTIPEDAEAGQHNFVVTITPAEGLPSTQTQPVTVVVHPKALGGPGESELPFVGQVSAEGAERADPAAPSSLTNSIGTIQSVLANPIVVGGAALAGFVLLLLVAFPAELLNSTISENYSRLVRVAPRATTPWWRRLRAWMQRTPIVGGIGLTLAAAVIFGFVDPNFGFDITSLRLVLACALALFVVGYLASALSGLIIRRRWGLATTIELKPLGLVLAVIGVILSRILEFSPGFMLGLLIGVAVVGSTTAALRAKAALVQVGVVFVLAMLGWVGYSILVATSTPDSFLTTLAFDTMVAVTTEGLTALFIGLLPVKLLDGPAIFEYSKLLWGLVYTVVAAAFVLIVVPAAWGEIDGPIWTWLAVLAGFAVVSLAVYLFFRFTAKDDEDAPAEQPAAPARAERPELEDLPR